MKLLKLPKVLMYTAKSRTSHYNDIKGGLMTPPVRLGENSVAWPAHEVNAIIAARIAGKTDDEIRQIVADLVADRKSICERVAV